ncbi:MAG: ferrous iron transporter B, partial [Planctomycetota bacterium]
MTTMDMGHHSHRRSTASTRSLTVALVGNPNTGKSTLFSALSGIPARIGNYPGVTVEKKIGRYVDGDGTVVLIDLPGTYSMAARTADEKVSVDVLLGLQQNAPSPDVVVVIVDATNLERNLYLFSQVLELGKPTILVLNMWDRVQAEGIPIDVPELERRLGIPVIPCSASRKQGVEALRKAIREAKPPPASTRSPLGEPFEQAVEALNEWLEEHAPGGRRPPFLVQRLILDVDGAIERSLVSDPQFGPALQQQLQQIRHRLAEQNLRVPMAETRLRYKWIRELLDGVLQVPASTGRTLSDVVDHVLTHRFWGFAVFLLVMFLVFQGITWGSSWMMDWIT